ncbi:MAG: ferredoxin--NADP reductase [Chitinophagaceae bacterium]
MTGSLIKLVRITAIEKLTDKSSRFILEPLDGWLPVYRAGQYLTLLFPHPDGEKRRSYSILSSPSRNEPLSIAVKKIDNGEFSRHLLYYTRPGDVLATAGIQGLFTLPENPSGYDYFFLAAGSGISPCLSLIKTLLTDTNERIILIYSNSSQKDVMFFDELEQLRNTFPERFRIRYLLSDIFRIDESRLSKSLLQRLLSQELQKDKPVLFYLCGPELYMLMIIITLRSMGFKNDQIKREDFDTRPRTHLPTPPDMDRHNVEININGRSVILPVQYPDSILATAKKNNVLLPYSCEAGRCGACLARCTEGEIWMAYNEVLTDEEVKRGLILSCQSFPINGDAKIVVNIS